MKQNKPSQPKRDRFKPTVDLASFPELNPNPISEVDLDGQIHYLNPAARRLFPTLKRKPLEHPWLVDWRSVADFFRHRETKSMLRRVAIRGRVYQQSVNYIAGIQRVRIYGLDITESERAEQALQVSETRYRRLFETAQDGILILDEQTGQITDVNPFLIEMLGYSPEELKGKKLWECGPFRDIAASKAAFLELQKKGHIRYENLPLETSAGRRMDVEFVSNVYEVDHKKVIQCNIRDITERTRAEQASRAAKDAADNEKLRLQAVMAALPVGVAITDAHGGNIQSNSMFESVWGGAHPPTREVSDYVGYKARWLDTGKLVLPEEWASAQAVQNGKSVVGQLMEIERFDGARGYVINSAAPVRDAGGNIVGAAVAIQDITELRITQDALRESEENYRRLIENVNDLVCEVDAQARYRFVNSQYEEVLGYAPVELLGKPVRDLIHPDDLKLSTPSFKKLVDGRTISRNEWRFKHKNGEWRWFDCAAQTYEKSPGDTRVVVISRDITDRKKKDAELQRLNRTLRALSNINQAMMRIQDETEFLQRVCQIIVEDCGHAMVWIGYAEEDEAKTVHPVASAGFEEGYLETLKITWADAERGRGPTGTTIRTGKPSGCSNMLTDPNFLPWRAEAIKRGYASSMVLPLMANGKAFGAITIYSREPGAFPDDEVKLLAELADDLAFGITAHRLRAAHAQAEEALRRSEERYHSLFNAMTEGFALHEIICDEEDQPCDYRFLDMNPAFERLTGLKREQAIGKTMREVLPDDDPLWIEAYGKVALTGEPVHFENYSLALDRHYEVFAYSPAPRQFAVVFSEITERKRMEVALRSSRDDLERTVAERTADLQIANVRLRSLTQDIVSTQEEERRRVSRELHDEAGQALTALKLSLQMMQDEMPSGWATYRQHLGDAVVLTDQTLEHIRMLAQDLRPPALESAGLNSTLQGLCSEFAQRTQIQINYIGTELPDLGAASICLYRFLQEALTNAARHGHATEIQVLLGTDAEHVCLSVEDNGQGFDPQKVLAEQGTPKSMGLIGMQERIKMVDGQLEIFSKPGCGARVTAHVPWRGT